jgi:hypothetical protein
MGQRQQKNGLFLKYYNKNSCCLVLLLMKMLRPIEPGIMGFSHHCFNEPI